MDGERRTERTGPIDWAPSELAVIEAAADARGQASTTFIAKAALAVASGRYRVTADAEGHGFNAEQVALLRQAVEQQMHLRRLLANATGSLNQLAAGANSGNPPTAAALDAARQYLLNQIAENDRVTALLLDLVDPE
ncbi:hypothetical protein [Amycolatopsis australiensis]|uniref:hypothetical protein n=1 Tax=Amycolatopsis australiensis TaxID=546364 RepID=UPI000931EC54|nr:hypothetical protein [Amycolatopsis australiensis]